MISFEIQIKSLIYMLLAGFMYALLYSLYNRFFYIFRRSIVIYILEIFSQTLLAYLVYIGLYFINHGILNIYLILMFLLGIYIYLNFYSTFFLSTFERFMYFLRKLVAPLRIVYLKIFGIIKKHKGSRVKK
ncbi:MAG: hypothetical protein IKM20_08370, partial [Erysipelotrichales bacterium]|nr:hypothetical protein [Erysipelotrichales bacterium]